MAYVIGGNQGNKELLEVTPIIELDNKIVIFGFKNLET